MELGSTARLSTVDAQGRRLWVYPADVAGKYRSRRNWMSGALLVFFIALPWFRVDGHQALLLDVWNGRFSIFGIRFWSHDAPMLLFVLGGAAVLLALVTVIWGRVWCGWACPQTVFVDSVFRKVERWIEGDSVTRRRLDAAPVSLDRVIKKAFKWSLFTLISVILSHSFLAYFIGTEALAQMMAQPPSRSLGSFLAMAAISAAVLFDFGWLREQFCTLICPYGRFQSVAMDDRSLAVAYDVARGEPRRGASSVSDVTGDCIDCRRCVQVCPTGIDIRNGLQLECVACTACADACDAVMSKLGKPQGLIRYTAGWGRGKGGYSKPIAYSVVFALFAAALVWTISQREPVQLTLIRSIGAPYEEVVRPELEKEVVNHFRLDLLNQSFEPVHLRTAAEGDPGLAGVQVVSANLPVDLAPGERRRVDVFIRFPLSRIQDGRGKIHIPMILSSKSWKEPLSKLQEVPLVGPLR